MFWDPNPDLIIIPIIHWPIKWYGLLFAAGFALGFVIFEKILYRFLGLTHPNDTLHLKDLARLVTDRITLYVVIATAVGARLGHFLFYEKPSDYLSHPFEILEIWKGGLSSHGAAIGIILVLCFFSFYSRKIDQNLSWIRLLDFICVPTALAGFFIRVGNFFNQEILGTQTNLPWGVIFGHPINGSMPVARHPVQIYEALFYLIVFFVLWRFSLKRFFLLHQGRLIGLFLIFIFGFRFVIEFFKLEQSQLITTNLLTMGQWLSIPLVIGGFVLLYFSHKDVLDPIKNGLDNRNY